MAELSFNPDQLIVSKTDLDGKITYGNDLFLALAGYSEEELIGAPHNIIRHPDMPKLIFKLLWKTIQAGEEINAYVINRSKNGDHYWVLANVTPSFDTSGKIEGYYSVRRKPDPKALEKVQALYRRLLQAEKTGGAEHSLSLLEQELKAFGGRYDRFVLSL